MDSFDLIDALGICARALEDHEEPLDGLRAALAAVSGASVVQILDETWDEAPLPEMAVSAITRPVKRRGKRIGSIVIGWPHAEPAPIELVALVDLLASAAGHALERRRLLDEATAAARTDALTGLFNRREWDDRIPMEIERAMRDHLPLSVALIDLDHFKPYNDTFGHQAGDRLLRECAARWRGHLRTNDLLARYGGEEFGVILPSTWLDEAVEVVERMREEVPGRQTASAGVVQWNGAEDASEIVRRADFALYAAKASGRDRVERG